MPDIYGYDTDSTITEADVAKAKSEGAGYVALYLGSGRNLTEAAARLISDAGLSILSFSENHGTSRMSQGAGAGSEDAASDVATARSIGQPGGTCIVAADDRDTTEAQSSTVQDYMRSYAGTLRVEGYKPGYYGNEATCHDVRSKGLADVTVRAGGSGMRGYGQFGDYDIAQDVGDKRHFNLRVSIDSETAKDALGLWSLASAVTPQPTPAPAPAPSPTPAPRLLPTIDVDDLMTRYKSGLAAVGIGFHLGAQSLQVLLNCLGAKPQLDVDGEVGDLTELALVEILGSRI